MRDHRFDKDPEPVDITEQVRAAGKPIARVPHVINPVAKKKRKQQKLSRKRNR